MDVTIFDLPAAFTLEDARNADIQKHEVYGCLEEGLIERVGRGVFVRPDLLEPAFIPLAAVTALHRDATLCLTSALVYHELSDAVPLNSHIALPRGTRHPAGFTGVTWHNFDPATLHTGRESVQVAKGVSVAIYSAERTIVDCFRGSVSKVFASHP